MTQSTTRIQERYRIERLIGTGGFGRVYLAHDERLGRQVAIKELSIGGLDASEQAAAFSQFAREAQMLAQLDHPGLTKIWDFFQHDGRAYLVMEYVPGPTLREFVLAYGGPLPEALTITCGLRLCDVLDYLHHRNPPIVFRDLKPGNVILEDLAEPWAGPGASLSPADLKVKLIDFGIARLFKTEQSSDTMIVGTPGYASPEQYGHSQTDTRSDIYSLGATLHHLASGQPPSGLLLPGLLEINPAASLGLSKIIARATAFKPAERYQTIDELRRDLRALGQSAGPARTAPISPRATVPLATRQVARPSNASPLMIVLVIGAILAVLGVGAFGLRTLGNSSSGTASAGQPTSGAVGTETPTEPASSALLPDATGRLIYSQCTQGAANCDIYETDIASQARRRLVGGQNNTAAVLSPDGSQLAVTVNGVVYVVALDGSGQRQISPTGMVARYAAFSPDGSQVAYTGSANGDARLFVFNGNSNATGVVEPNFTQYGWVTWSRQGLTYAAANEANGVQDIYLLANDGTTSNLTNTPDVEEEFPAWSADASQLVFTASTPGDLNTRQIFRMNSNGSNRQQVTRDQGPHTNPAFSPEGNWITFVSRGSSGPFRLWAIRTDGSDARPLEQGSSEDGGQFFVTWAP